MPRIAIVTSDVLSSRMAGPAIRAWHIARILSRDHDVQLLSTQRCDIPATDFECRRATPAEVACLGDHVDLVVLQGEVLRIAPGLRSSDAAIVVDLYDPFQLEVLEQARGFDRDTARAALGSAVDVVNEQLRRGDFFICASERQRDFWIGALASVGRVNERTYDASENLRALIAVVPFGVEEVPPVHTQPVLRGVRPGIGRDDELVLWGGGIYNWFDPLSLIEAVDRLRHRRERIRLFFAGVVHPNPAVPDMEMARRARSMAESRGLVDRHVFFHEWIEYDLRQNYLLEADVGVSMHVEHVETAFSFRTRVLDYFWAGLPTVLTRGDVLAELVAEAGAGLVVPPRDVVAIEQALDALLASRERRLEMSAAARALGRGFAWPTVLEPLSEFCAYPRRSPDLADPEFARWITRGRNLMPHRLVWATKRAARLARSGDWEALRAKVGARLRPGSSDELEQL